MAITLSQIGSLVFAEAGAVTSTLVSTVAGALLVGLGAAYNPGELGASAMTDSQSNAWYRAQESSRGEDPFGVAAYAALNTTGGVTGITLTPSTGTFPALVTAAFTVPAGTTAGTPVTASGSSRTLKISGAAPTSADNVGLLAFSWYGNQDPPTPAGWTLLGKKTDFVTSQTLAAYYRIQTTPDEFTASWALISGPLEWVAVLMSFSAPAGGPVDAPMARESGMRRRVFGRTWGRVN